MLPLSSLHQLVSVILFIASLTLGQQSLPCSNTNPCRRFRVDELYNEPTFYQSRARRLDITMSVEMAEIRFDWLKIWRRTYNGAIGGPTWMVYPGDTLNLRLENKLGPNPVNDTGPNTYHKPNTTNIHVHGLHISPEGISDNVFLTVEPGAVQQYQFNIPEHHPAGTYWYHPHFHGSGNFQVSGGMAGLIIIQDNPYHFDTPYELRMVSCPLNCNHDMQMLIQPTLQYNENALPNIFGEIQEQIQDDPLFRNEQYAVPGADGNLAQWLFNTTNEVNYFTVNGQLKPRMYFRAGQMKRLRFANAGGAHALELEVISLSNGRKCEWREIALDGVYLPSPRVSRTGQSLVLPGGRVDWLLRCDYQGVYQIVSTVKPLNNPTMGQFDRFSGVLATVQVYGGSVAFPLDFPLTLPPRPQYMPDLRYVGDRERDQFVVEMGTRDGLNREQFPADPSIRIRHKMQLGRLQEWTFVNPNPFLLHPMHIHVNHFQVISYNKYDGPIIYNPAFFAPPDDGPGGMPQNQTGPPPPEPVERFVDQNGDYCEYQYDGFMLEGQTPARANLSSVLNMLGHDTRYYTGPGFLGYAEIGEYRDTIPIPPLSNVTIRFIPTDYTGRVLVHCHNTVHSDQGMLLNAEIVPAGSSTAGARVPSNNVYPGTCHPGDWYPGVPNLPPPSTIASTTTEPTTTTTESTTTTTTTTTPTTTATQQPLDFLAFATWLLTNYPTNLADYFRNPNIYHDLYRQSLSG
nr:uncharacterized protein LOC100187450 [Ciona intestinalis]|eukprot:XP_002123563.1 uncharacterized protein LOC100187450 [Ciona intestinalis]